MNKILFNFAIVVLVTACSTVAITGRKQLSLVSDSEILSLSATEYKQFIDSVPASKNVAQTEMVKKVGARIAAAVEEYLKSNGRSADVANLKWEFNLVKDSVVNAFCMPGGKVVVFEGILPVTKNETGLAVVMGHEIAHAIAKHSNERMSHQVAAQYGAGILNMAMAKKTAATKQIVSTAYGLGANYGVILPYSRKHEHEADQLGLVFMAMAGYDPTEAIAFWERMAAGNKSSVMEIMSTHPSDANRIATLKTQLPEALKYYKK